MRLQYFLFLHTESKKHGDICKNMYLGFLGSLIFIIQNGGWRSQKRKKHDDIGEKIYSGVLGLLDNESVRGFLSYKMAAAKTKYHDDIILNYEHIIVLFFRLDDHYLESAILRYRNLITNS